MIVKKIVDEDFVNYKKPSMLIAFPLCNFKCGKNLCQNSELFKSKDIETSYHSIVNRYIKNDITSSIVFQGMEPLFTYDDCINLILEFRKETEDDIVVYTGYNRNEKEVLDFIDFVLTNNIKNIIIKTGRYIPNDEIIYDDVLGVNLVSNNQKGEKIS